MKFYREFNPLMYNGWLTLTLKLIRFENDETFSNRVIDAVRWCEECCTSRWSFNASPYYSSYPDTTFFFKNPTDQLLFKLTFGGS